MDSSQKRILIVDDEADIRAMLKRAIERTLKIPADTASSGLEALEQIRETRYDLMVTDLSMPEMDGLALFRAVKERHPEIQVIVLTATASVETSMAAVKSHVYSYLTKPISMDRFIKEVEAALAALDASRPTPATRDLASVLAAVDKAAADIGAKIDRLAGQAPVEALVELKGLSVHLKEQLGYLRILVGDGRPPA